MVELIKPMPTVAAIYKSYEKGQVDNRRPHLGGSIIGHECNAYLWRTFRWCKTVGHDGRLLKLFKRGWREEEFFCDDLEAAGVTILSRQDSVSCANGHAGGSTDGRAIGLKEAPKKEHVLEFKTHSEKSFNDLEKKGVFVSKPLHYAQMQFYMYLIGIDRAFYLAVNKNNDEMYSERIKLDVAYASKLVAKSEMITQAENLPEKEFSPDWYKCRWCDYKDQCHGEDLPERNCRTCLHSTPVDNGEWKCEKYDKIIPLEGQKERYECHRFIPSLIKKRQIDVDGDNIIYDGWVDKGE